MNKDIPTPDPTNIREALKRLGDEVAVKPTWLPPMQVTLAWNACPRASGWYNVRLLNQVTGEEREGQAFYSALHSEWKRSGYNGDGFSEDEQVIAWREDLGGEP